MFPPIWERVVSGHYPKAVATLAGYARFALKNDTYPGMIASQDQEVIGALYRDVSDADLSALDVFEGSEYQRCSVQVDIGTTEKIWAETYVFLPHERLSGQPWDPAAFAVNRFMGAYCPERGGA